MPIAEIGAAITSLNATLSIAKAMVGLRDAEAFRAKSIEMQGLILESLSKSIEAREAYSAQLDRIRALEKEVADLKDWGAEKQNYELKPIGNGSVACMLKPDKRGAEPPHWLCATCFEKGKKSHLQFSTRMAGGGSVFRCKGCDGHVVTSSEPAWS